MTLPVKFIRNRALPLSRPSFLGLYAPKLGHHRQYPVAIALCASGRLECHPRHLSALSERPYLCVGLCWLLMRGEPVVLAAPENLLPLAQVQALGFPAKVVH